jgi:hypothetical protein
MIKSRWVSQIKVGNRGQAFLVDAQGRLIAHPDISLVLRKHRHVPSGAGGRGDRVMRRREFITLGGSAVA